MGDAFWPMTSARLNLGDDIIKKLFVDQEPVLSRDTRQMAEFMVRGRYPIALGVNPLLLGQFQKQGLGKNLKLCHFPEMDTVNSSSTPCGWSTGRPHPNAAKVFINWLLTKDAQVVWAKEVETNSRRVGVEPGNPPFAVPRGRQALPGRRGGEPARGRQDAGHRQSGDQVDATATWGAEPGGGETVLALDDVSKLFGAARGRRPHVARDPARRGVHAAGAERLRQDHHPPPRRRARAARRRRDHPARPPRRLGAPAAVRAAEQAQPRHGLPVVRHLAAHDRVRQRGLSAAAARRCGGPPSARRSRACSTWSASRAWRRGRPRC